MRKYILLSVLLSLCNISDLSAAVKDDGKAYRETWNITAFPSDRKCINNLENAGITVHDDCVAKWGKVNSSVKICILDRLDGYCNYGGTFYIAREMNEGGAKFCKTIVAADRGSCTGKPYTTYYEGGGECFWLCRSGYHGSGCSKVETADTCQSYDGFKKNVAEKYSYASYLKSFSPSTNIEANIPMFFHGEYYDCNKGSNADAYNKLPSTKNQEHDVVLAIQIYEKKDTDKTLRISAMPLVVRAGGTRDGCLHQSQYCAWPMVGFVPEITTYVCPEGWIQQADGWCKQDGNSSACQLTNMCANYPKEKYDPEKHHIRPGSTCNEFRCNEGTAFKSKDDLTCTPCAPTDAEIPALWYQGVSDGLCTSCNKGQWPVLTYRKVNGKDTSIVDKVECDDAKPFTHNELQYGQKTVPDKVETTQCWTKQNPDDFFGCVTRECRNGDAWTQDGDCEPKTSDGGGTE